MFVASDHTKRERIYEVDLVVIADLHDRVADENIWYGLFARGSGAVRLSQHDLVEVGMLEAGEVEPNPHPDEVTLRAA